jgi:hypothetical protein
LAAAIVPLISVAAHAEGAAQSSTPAYRVTAPQTAAPKLDLSQQPQWTMPANSTAAVQPDKTAVIVDKLLTIGTNVRLSPSTHSDIDVMTPERVQERPKGAYLNLKINW